MKDKGKKIILIGISGAGKSTLCETLISANPNFIRLNRDTLRESFMPNHSEYWYSPNFTLRNKLESHITDFLNEIDSLNSFTIDDNTNLNYKRLKNTILNHNFFYKELEIILIKDSKNIELCIERDLNRSRTVGEEVIKRQYQQFMTLEEKLLDLKRELKESYKTFKIIY